MQYWFLDVVISDSIFLHSRLSECRWTRYCDIDTLNVLFFFSRLDVNIAASHNYSTFLRYLTDLEIDFFSMQL